MKPLLFAAAAAVAAVLLAAHPAGATTSPTPAPVVHAPLSGPATGLPRPPHSHIACTQHAFRTCFVWIVR